ncbi:MAG TPA: bacillithiol biosynthesis deacetylase BshB1 [Bryobacteraceae bacterium]|nr:bacillithiol biosynthesis deacetylase BshB1 [Bryobacteraceae bacterium]
MSVEVLLFGAHPDDVEWGAGGISLLLQKRNISFALVDLTRGEMGSRGTREERDTEARKAAEFLGAAGRENLDLPDCGLEDTPETRMKVADVIRQYRPRLVLAPYWEDRHPDHAAAGMMVKNSSLYCMLRKTPSPHAPHKPAAFLYFLLHNFKQPTFVADISDVHEMKKELMLLHKSQFAKTAEQHGVLSHGLGDYLFGLESRDRFFGSLIGKHYGEALVADRPLTLSSADQILQLSR